MARRYEDPKLEAEALASALEDAVDEESCCRVCGCSEDEACPDGCVWAEPDLCSRCAR